LFESRGTEVIFGGLDDFFAGLVGRIEAVEPRVASSDPLDHIVALRPSTLDVAHALRSQPPNVAAMYNGRPATYGDIEGGFTFQRAVAGNIVTQFRDTDRHISVVLGPSGVGKTTAARQALRTLSVSGVAAWEHSVHQPFLSKQWREVADVLKSENRTGVLFIDDAHEELAAINGLIESLNSAEIISLKLGVD
jgi:hypothetical protein